jgi:hypothetical protein
MVIAGSDFKDNQNHIEEEERKVLAKTQAATQLHDFYEKHIFVLRCDANTSLITEYLGGPEFVTKENLETAWGHPKFQARLAMYRSDVQLREALEKEIYGLLAGSDAAKDHVIKNLRYKNIQEIRTQRDTLKDRTELQKLDVDALRTIVKGESANEFEVLPVELRDRKSLANLPASELRVWIRRCGVSQINQYLQRK